MRDNFLRQNVLQTDQYRYATFVPKQAPGLPSAIPASGEVDFQLTGDLTIRNVTKSVTWDVQAQVQGDDVTAKVTTALKFEDFDLTQPRVPLVLSIVDNIALEADVQLRRVTN